MCWLLVSTLAFTTFIYLCWWRDRVSRDLHGSGNEPAEAFAPAEVSRPATIAAAENHISIVERQYPVRIKLGIPAGGLGPRLEQIHAWLDQACGANSWVISGIGGNNHTLALYLLDATLVGAFVVRWCATSRIGDVEGVFKIRADDAPTVRLVGIRQKMPETVPQWFVPAA